MTDFITPEALVRQFREDSCVDCIHTDCRARRDCADELEAAAVKWAARDAELVALLEPFAFEWVTMLTTYPTLLPKLANENVPASTQISWAAYRAAHEAVNRLSGVQK